MKYYPAHEIEKKWQKYWEEKGFHKAPEKPKKKYYVLEMFPYPSGDLHMGHLKNYVIGDVVARVKKMEGYDILHPMGWDAFGLPAENAAIKHGINPKDWTLKNIDTFRKTLKMIGISYDWDREIGTCFPDYYKWTQYLFTLLYKRGLAYRKKERVNYCPSCKTVLANEQVINGKCERCGTPVIKKELEQWFFKITDYAERLLKDLDKLKGRWPDYVIKQQENWIGKSYGTEIVFKYEKNPDIRFPVFTTRADTVFGVTFVTIAPEHELIKKIWNDIEDKDKVSKYVKEASLKTDLERTAEEKEKTGVFTGLYLLHPFTGERVPLYIGDYVLVGYGTGIVMGVPAHDQRDFLFAKKHNLPIKVVIKPKDGEAPLPEKMERAYEEKGVMINSGEFTGMSSDDGIKAIQKKLKDMGLGGEKVSYRIRDWLISRQRYWGAPIPVVYCEKCGIVPEPLDRLPVKLPENIKDYKPKGRSPLEDVEEFMNTTCPVCGGPARRDPDTMDTFVDSSWYFLRYTDPKNDKEMFNKEKSDMWMPVDQYIGGKEHATKHLIYARFIQKVLYDEGLTKYDEPFLNLFTQGLVHKPFLYCKKCGKVVEADEVENGIHKNCGGEVEERVEMMSKSRGNVVRVGPFVEKHGADVARVTILFASPPEKDMVWQDSAVEGAKRFLTRIYNLFVENKDILEIDPKVNVETLNEEEKNLYILLQKTIFEVRKDANEFSFNTAIARLMELLNALYAFKNRKSKVYKRSLYDFVILLAPFAPHLAEELYHFIDKEHSVFERTFPSYDEKYLSFDKVEIPVQVNGKVRGRITIEKGISKEEALKKALNEKNVKRYIEGRDIVKVVFIKDKLLNIVVK